MGLAARRIVSLLNLAFFHNVFYGAGMEKKPVFIHCMPRTGSTWFSERIGKPVDVMRFYEPFHDALAYNTAADFQADHKSRENGKRLRHPQLKEHRFFAYDFNAAGGVPGFQKRFTFEDFYMEQAANDPGLQSYLQGLLDKAAAQGKAAILKNVCSALRGAWMKSAFGGAHVYLLRHPRAMDNSNFGYRGFSNFYSRENVMILGKNAGHPVFAEAARWAGLENFEGQSVEEESLHYYRASKFDGHDGRYNRQFHYDVLCFLWVLGLAHATRYADVIVDYDALGDEEKRADLWEMLSKVTDLPVDFSDYKPRAMKELFAISEEMRDIIKRALQRVQPDWAALDRFPLTKSNLDILEPFVG